MMNIRVAHTLWFEAQLSGMYVVSTWGSITSQLSQLSGLGPAAATPFAAASGPKATLGAFLSSWPDGDVSRLPHHCCRCHATAAAAASGPKATLGAFLISCCRTLLLPHHCCCCCCCRCCCCCCCCRPQSHSRRLPLQLA
jgi:hypothetical protein